MFYCCPAAVLQRCVSTREGAGCQNKTVQLQEDILTVAFQTVLGAALDEPLCQNRARTELRNIRDVHHPGAADRLRPAQTPKVSRSLQRVRGFERAS